MFRPPAGLANEHLWLVYHLFWYAPDGHTVRGRARDRPYYVEVVYPGGSLGNSDVCRSELLTG